MHIFEYLNIQCSHNALINFQINIQFMLINIYYIQITVVYSKEYFSEHKYLFEYSFLVK